jgi:HEAT repeat protein
MSVSLEKKLLTLLEADRPTAVRCAALLVVQELGLRSPAVGQRLCRCLEDADPQVRLRALQALGQLRWEKALPQLLERIHRGGEEAAEAAQAAARLGSRGVRALQQLLPRVAPGVRRYIAAALAAAGNPAAELATVAVLLDKDPAVVEAAVRTLVAQVPELPARQRSALAEQVLALLRGTEALPPASEAALVRVLAALDVPQANAALWDRVLPPHPPEIRLAALQALGRHPGPLSREQFQRLLTCATDADFRVAAPALRLLQALPPDRRAAADWLPLFQAPDLAVRRLALEKVGACEEKEVVRALVAQLLHPDRRWREEVLACLVRGQQGRTALTQALLNADHAEQAWSLARTLAPHAGNWPASGRRRLWQQTCRYLEAGDHRAEPLLFLLRQAEPEELSRRLEEQARSWRKKQDYARALVYLRILARDPAVGFPIRWELAACGLKVSPREWTRESRQADPCLQQFVTLAQRYRADWQGELERTDWLTADELYYLGFHLAEQEGVVKQLGRQVLHLVCRRAPRSRAAQAARAKLRSAGLD